MPYNRIDTSDKILLSQEFNAFFASQNIKISDWLDENGNKINLKLADSLFSIDSLEIFVYRKLENKVDIRTLDGIFKDNSFRHESSFILDNFLYYEDGTSINDYQFRRDLIRYYGISNVSNSGIDTFIKYHKNISDVLFRINVIGDTKIRADSARTIILDFLGNKLNENDLHFVDYFLKGEVNYEKTRLNNRNQLHKKGLQELKSNIDSLYDAYKNKLNVEKSRILMKLSSEDTICLNQLYLDLIKTISNRELVFNSQMELEKDGVPFAIESIMYNYQLMKTFPSTQYTNAKLGMKIHCFDVIEKFNDSDYFYLSFEEKLDDITSKFSPSYGTIGYSYYGEAQLTILNMLLYYTNSIN